MHACVFSLEPNYVFGCFWSRRSLSSLIFDSSSLIITGHRRRPHERVRAAPRPRTQAWPKTAVLIRYWRDQRCAHQGHYTVIVIVKCAIDVKIAAPSLRGCVLRRSQRPRQQEGTSTGPREHVCSRCECTSCSGSRDPLVAPTRCDEITSQVR